MEKFDANKVLRDLKIILKKLLEAKPELKGWAEKNYGQYIEKDN